MLASARFLKIYDEFGRISRYFRVGRRSTDGVATAAAHNFVIVRTVVVCNDEQRTTRSERAQRTRGPRCPPRLLAYGVGGRRITFAASDGDIIGFAGVAGTVVAVPGVVMTTRVTPLDVDTVVVVRPSEAASGGAGGAPALRAAAVTPGVVTPGVAAP
jgi:hypothetical protein